MKSTVNYLKRFAAVAVAILFVSTAVFADGEATEVYLSGSTNTAAGDFVVTGTDEVYHFQGEEFQVYNVYYDNPSHNMKIAVLDEGDCKSYIAFTDGYWFMYNCTKEGFGVRKAMFTSALVRDGFDARQYSNQTILVKKKNIERDQAVGLIAAYLPKLQG
ncbi:MAG: hypothetical protein E4H10_11325 [Bacteroidia bacterium]|nr:MAG: hypothetical protein E4H10_11325 [Bacteroidia bacterium]